MEFLRKFLRELNCCDFSLYQSKTFRLRLFKNWKMEIPLRCLNVSLTVSKLISKTLLLVICKDPHLSCSF